MQTARLKHPPKYRTYPFWLARIVQSARYNLLRLPLAKRYPLSDAADLDGRKPLFIVSAGRSGTTLLRSMLVAGGQIAIPPETQIVHWLALRFSGLQQLGWNDLSALMIANFERHHLFKLWETNLAPAYETALHLPQEQRSLARVIDAVYMTYAAQQFPQAITWGDQSPIHTFYASWIEQVFPQAKYIHMLRDGRDAIASLVERGLTLEESTQRWIMSVKHAHRLRDRVGQHQYLEIRYESLVTDPEANLRRVCDFLELRFDPQMLDYWKLPTTLEHKHHSFHRNLNKPVFASSIGRWAERLNTDQQQYVLARISDVMKSLEYTE